MVQRLDCSKRCRFLAAARAPRRRARARGNFVYFLPNLF
jgi:hypothetical protein